MQGFFSRCLDYLKPYRWLAFGSLIALLLTSLGSLAIPQFFQHIIDEGIVKQDLSVIRDMTLILIIIAVFSALMSFLNSFWAQKVSQDIAFDIRNQLYAKLQALEFSFHDRHNIGQLVTRMTSDVEAMRGLFANGIYQVISSALMLVGSIIILAQTQWKLLLVVIVVIPLIAVIFALTFKKLGPIFGRVQQNLGVLNNILQENIAGIRIVKSFTAETHELNRYNRQNKKIFDANIDVVTTFSNSFPLIFFLSNIATLAVIGLGGQRVIEGQMTIGTLVEFNSYLTFLVLPLFQLGFVLQQVSRSQASAQRIFSILDIKKTIVAKPDALAFAPEESCSIRFENVAFSYTGDDEDLVLRDVSFDLTPGTTTAICGLTGSGKSTLVNLIPRFYDPSAGRVVINGIDVRDYDPDSLRAGIGMVLQSVRLINGSVRDNIIYGVPDAKDAAIQRVCDIAQVTPFLQELDGGLDFDVGEGGSNLSGGQRQRVAIARSLLVNPRIVVFDDAMSALDALTQSEFSDAIRPYRESGNYTTLIISQTPSTIRRADWILVMDKGHIVDQGHHDDLIGRCAVYQAVIDAQGDEQ